MFVDTCTNFACSSGFTCSESTETVMADAVPVLDVASDWDRISRIWTVLLRCSTCATRNDGGSCDVLFASDTDLTGLGSACESWCSTRTFIESTGPPVCAATRETTASALIKMTAIIRFRMRKICIIVSLSGYQNGPQPDRFRPDPQLRHLLTVPATLPMQVSAH